VFYLSVLVPLQRGAGKRMRRTLQGQRAVDLHLDLFGRRSFPRDVVLIDLRGNWRQETRLVSFGQTDRSRTQETFTLPDISIVYIFKQTTRLCVMIIHLQEFTDCSFQDKSLIIMISLLPDMCYMKLH